MKFVAISNRTGITGDVITIGANPNPITFHDIVIEVTVAATLTIEIGGSVPGGGSNPITPTPLTPGGTACAAQAWNTSNSTSGAVASIVMSIAAGVPYTVNLKHFWLGGGGSNKLITFRLAHASGNSKVAVYFEEN
jgi:hypothetical protein